MKCIECKYYDKKDDYCTWITCDGIDCEAECPYDDEEEGDDT